MPFDRKIKQFKDIQKNINKFIAKSVNDNANVIIDNIVEDQMYDKGEDGLGRSLGEYSNFTKEFKTTIAGQLGRDTKVDHITLRDTGAFHESINIKQTSKGIEIISDPIKDDGTNLLDEFGEEILFLSDDNLDAFIQTILLDDLRRDIRAAL